jgi:integrase
MPVGNWLSAEQGKRLLRTVDVDSLRGKRDYATLAILLSCGLRRAELAALRVEDIQIYASDGTGTFRTVS